MKRVAVLLVSLVFAVPALARVISYAPYTNRVAEPLIQSRAARHFVLIESEAQDYAYRDSNEVVLYDSTGVEEPRVVTPEEGVFFQGALYQKEGEAPVILLLGVASGYTRAAWVGQGGDAWTRVAGLGAVDYADIVDVDTGGPFTRGLFAPIVIGNDAWPFIATIRGNGVWAISRTGASKRLFAAGARVIGRNAAGDRFLVTYENALWMTSVDGPPARLANALASGIYAGWITANGTVYAELAHPQGRYLFRIANGALQLIAGDGDAAPTTGAFPQRVPVRFLAIPTHDYEGAWIIRRRAGEPTTLQRHTPADGLETMWSDAKSPEVEALIAGASGETVLVQVHRPRPGAQLQQPFLDPALAVWRIGQPAPREYEELYLNEAPNKGFVIVDPDAIESGTPFVFDSGFEAVWEPSQSRVSAPILSSDVMQEWGVVRGSFRQRLVFPGVARLRGAYSSFWQTDLTIYNPLAERQQVEVRFVPLGLQDSVSATLTLEPREIRAIPDALKSLFYIDDGGGTLHLLPAIGINATARTYSRRDDGGTFGFGMHALDFFNAAGPRFAMSFAGAFPGDDFRTNLLVTDTSGRGANVSATPVTGAYGSNSGTQVDARASSTVQVQAGAGVRFVWGGGLIVQPTRGTAIASVVAIDNRSNDPTYLAPDLPGTVPRAIPVIGHVEGANGAQFRTDLYLYNPRDTTRQVELVAKMWDSSLRRVSTLTLWPRENRVIKDVMATLFRLEGIAHLTISNPTYQEGDAVRVTSRTYTVDAEGATYGCLVPPLNGFQVAASGDTLEILGVSAGPGFRTNVGLAHLDSRTNAAAPTVRVMVVGDRGHVYADGVVSVPRYGGMQINDIFRALNVTPPPAALLRVEVLTGDQIAAYATVTDNKTNDSIYLGSQLAAKP